MFTDIHNGSVVVLNQMQMVTKKFREIMVTGGKGIQVSFIARCLCSQKACDVYDTLLFFQTLDKRKILTSQWTFDSEG